MNAVPGGLGWMYGRDLPLLSLTFARGLTPNQLLDRMGADPDTVAVRDRRTFDRDFEDLLLDEDGYVVQAGRHGAWSWAWEEGSRRCVEDRDLILRVSAGTEALVLHKNEKTMVDFRYARDGRLVTGINTLCGITADGRSGSSPDHFVARMRELGADPDNAPGPGIDEYGPLGCSGLFYRLAEDLGVVLPHEDLVTHPSLNGRLRG
ncbi:DUF6461 domain-containing protein [Actinocorallia libanotica]|uniref:Uncharacterized protein n=1 Tax=Actinocorallia libanotica TaxID=46162 RepID=A0ABP4CGA0_9ACTN